MEAKEGAASLRARVGQEEDEAGGIEDEDEANNEAEVGIDDGAGL